MPIVSPHRSTASGLSGSYRSSYSSSLLDRPPYFGSSYSPRSAGSYSERFTTRSYTDVDGRRVFSRSGSITEDGVTTRFREETREGSLRRDSLSRDSSTSYRDGSILDYSRRDNSATRNDRLSSLNVYDSVAEMRNKYSPANYVPAHLRKNENISRSKSINDIGLPPIESKLNKKKVNEALNYNNSVLHSNNTNNDNMTIDEDDNGNRASVADLCKKFESPPKEIIAISNGSSSVSNRTKKSVDHLDSGHIKPSSLKRNLKSTEFGQNGVVSNGALKQNGYSNLTSKTSDVIGTTDDGHLSKCAIINNLEVNSKFDVEKEQKENEIDKNGTCELKGGDTATSLNNDNSTIRITSRINNFASYIPVKEDKKNDVDIKDKEEPIQQLNGSNNKDECSENGLDNLGKNMQRNDLSTSAKLNRSAISPSNSTSHSSGINSTNTTTIGSRRSIDRDPRRSDYGDEDSDRIYNNIRPLASSPVKTLGLNGLKNIGNTCFMNSVIQCLSNTKLLLEYLRKDEYSRDINTTISGMKGALIKAFAEVIKELWSEDSSDRVVNTVSLKSQIQRFAPRFMGYAQQDAQEFLRYLLEGLHEDVNRVTEKPKPILTEIDEKLSDSEKAAESWSRYLRMDNSRIVDIFVGQLKSTLKCTHCGHCSVTFDPFWDLSLPIPQKTGQLRLSQCLESFTREETLDGDEKPTCSKCKERRKCTKSFSIQKFPKILVIHLKRFSPTERFRGKLNVTVDFPLEDLDMSNYAADSISPCRYNLYAISNHSGTTYSGHYTAYCRHPFTKTWHEYNDSRVSSISPKSIVSGEAYVLFYEQEGQKSHL